MNFSRKQLNPLIEKYHINIESDTFKEIINLFGNSVGYHVWAVKAFYNNNMSLDNLKYVKSFIDDYHYMIALLRKETITAYKTNEELCDLMFEIKGAMKVSFVQNVLNTFNTNQKHLCYDTVFGDEPIDLKKWGIGRNDKEHIYNVLRRFNSSTKKKTLMTRISATNSFNDIISLIEDGVSDKYDWSKESLLSFVECDSRCVGVDVSYEKDDIVVLRIPTYDASFAIGNGRAEWCIVTDRYNWESYANHGNSVPSKKEGDNFNQYFLFDFRKKDGDDESMIAFTMNTRNGSMYANNRKRDNITNTIESYLHDMNIGVNDLLHVNIASNVIWTYYGIKQMLRSCSTIVEDNGTNLLCAVVDKAKLNDLTKQIAISITDSDVKNKEAVFDKFIVLFDTNKLFNDSASIITVSLKKDDDGIAVVDKILDARRMEYGKTTYNNMFATIINAMNDDNPYVIFSYIRQHFTKLALDKLHNPNIDVNIQSKKKTLFTYAMEQKQYEIAENIIKHPTFQFNVSEWFCNVFFYILLWSRTQKLQGDVNIFHNIKHLLFNVRDNIKPYINDKDNTSETLIHLVAGRYDMNEILEVLLSIDGVDVNITTDKGLSPYDYALKSKNFEGARMIASHPSFIKSENDKEFEEKYVECITVAS